VAGYSHDASQISWGPGTRIPIPGPTVKAALDYIDLHGAFVDFANIFVKTQTVNGEAGSDLAWQIIEWPTWGTWTFTPESGNNLTPEDGIFTVQVSVVAPNKKESEFDGYIWVENKDNSSDFDKIYVYLQTPKNVQTINTIINNFILKFRNIISEKLGIYLKYLGWF
jgi:hypothetical protein